jgi:hypothetical protein
MPNSSWRPAQGGMSRVSGLVEELPRDATHGSRASMAGRSGLSKSTVGRIWRKFDLEPHLIDGFKPSTDQSSQPGPAPSSWLQAARPC